MAETTTYLTKIDWLIGSDTDQNLETITFNKESIQNFVFTIKEHFDYSKRKQHYQNKAITNLYKTNKLLQLDIQLANGYITDKEYHAEISQNHNSYIIEMDVLRDRSEILIMREIIQDAQLGVDIGSDEVSDIFSVDHESLLSQING